MNLADRAWSLLSRAQEVYADNPRASNWLRKHLTRLGEPVRLAVVGEAGSGKTTLVAALTGDADRGGVPNAPKSWRHVTAGRAWPELLVLDASLPEQHSTARVVESMGVEADAVLYLLGPHDADTASLRALHEWCVPELAPVNALAVLARADELGGGRVDALTSARQVARRWARESPVVESCQDVVAVAGLLARAARTLRREEFEMLAALAAVPKAELEPLLLSVDRFGSEPRRAELLARFGLFGIRLATTLIRNGIGTPQALTAELCRRSGLDALGEAVSVYFTDRAPVLKARSALLGLGVMLRREPRPSAAPLVTELERTLMGAHEFAELRLFAALRTGRVSLPGELGEEAARLVGGYGDTPRARLAPEAAGEASEPVLRQAAAEALRSWRSYAENPVLSSTERQAAATVVRTCEALLTGPL
ncbi:hypothetical protein [Saccharomonospora glauca]|jgi:hypothetical protein|uniref:GTPase n=1 Tax=Saccharomonospora glauca K62 TaxID=928724 RepID=I1D7H9_9PSEU|nr:hypothetical protein [Saccharomonospora glauca]EIF00904.1 hypothetical protein SacglDRAFT_04065 [Saccharomonospora glauca K62]